MELDIIICSKFLVIDIILPMDSEDQIMLRQSSMEYSMFKRLNAMRSPSLNARMSPF